MLARKAIFIWVALFIGTVTGADAPDVSGLVYLEMRSLGEIAEILGKGGEAVKWRESAEVLRGRVNALLWDPVTESYYDRDSSGQFVRMLSDVLLRATYCGLPTEIMARRIFERHILNPAEFWTACPLPSFALNDPHSTPDKPDTWSGPTFPLTNLRAPYGFLAYGRRVELRELLPALSCRRGEPAGVFPAIPSHERKGGRGEVGAALLPGSLGHSRRRSTAVGHRAARETPRVEFQSSRRRAAQPFRVRPQWLQ